MSLALQSGFTQSELLAIHRYCLRYRDLVRGGGVPTRDQDQKFIAFQRVTYGEGVAREHG